MNSIDWTAVGSITSSIGVIAAIVFFIFENRRSKFSRAIDILMQYDNKFDSPEFRATRRRAAEFLLSGGKSDDEEGRQAINDVLNFFENIAFLYDNNVVNAKMVWHTFASWFLPYWKTSETYIKESRSYDSTSYENSDALFNKVLAIEKKRCHNSLMVEEDYLKKFIRIETELPCNR